VRWTELVIHTTTEASELVAELATQCGAKGIAIEDRNDLTARGETAQWDWVDASLLESMPEDCLVRATFPEEALAGLAEAQARIAALAAEPLGFDAGSLAMHTSLLDDTDWAEQWKQYYKPFRVGSRLVVKPSWEPYVHQLGDLVLEIDPGMAFGTGTHETTALCLELLEGAVSPGAEVLDVGCGSGILAIAAARLGARSVEALDVDPIAVRTARENITRNGLDAAVSARELNLLADSAAAPGPYDLIVANIIADVVIALAALAASRLRSGGTFLCSGIIQARAADVRAALAQAGLVVYADQDRGEWVALAARKGAPCTAS
jgi:ribosomal protein L11 methyltransferase